jgi:hypothetical protein
VVWVLERLTEIVREELFSVCDGVREIPKV